MNKFRDKTFFSFCLQNYLIFIYWIFIGIFLFFLLLGRLTRHLGIFGKDLFFIIFVIICIVLFISYLPYIYLKNYYLYKRPLKLIEKFKFNSFHYKLYQSVKFNPKSERRKKELENLKSCKYVDIIIQDNNLFLCGIKKDYGYTKYLIPVQIKINNEIYLSNYLNSIEEDNFIEL